MNTLVETVYRERLAKGVQLGKEPGIYVSLSHDVLTKTTAIFGEIIGAIESANLKSINRGDHYELSVKGHTLSSENLTFRVSSIGPRGVVGSGKTPISVVYLNKWHVDEHSGTPGSAKN